MTNPNDPAFAHEGSHIAVHKELWDLFPHATKNIFAIAHKYDGLTKREYFAAMALIGTSIAFRDSDSPKVIASAARQIADALIAELDKSK